MASSSHHIDNRHDDVIVDILQGRERIVSYPTTNRLRGITFGSCGLAAMNFASVVLELIHHHEGRLMDVLRAITSKDTIEVSVATRLCSSAHHMLSLLTQHSTTGDYLHLFCK